MCLSSTSLIPQQTQLASLKETTGDPTSPSVHSCDLELDEDNEMLPGSFFLVGKIHFSLFPHQTLIWDISHLCLPLKISVINLTE